MRNLAQTRVRATGYTRQISLNLMWGFIEVRDQPVKWQTSRRKKRRRKRHFCTNSGLGPLQASAKVYLREIGAKNTPAAPDLGSFGGDVKTGISQKTQG